MASKNAKLNKFNLSHDHKTSLNMGQLIPVAFIECLPNDWFKIQNEFLVRFMATIAPVMHIYKISLQWWYTPYRILLDKWQDFITGGEDGQDATVLPYVSSGASGFAKGSLADHFGMPTGVPNLKVNAWPFRAYTLIVNEWYRNQALQEKLPLSLASGEDTTTNTSIFRRNWERDYFTDALPSPQKGPAVSIGLTGDAPVIADVSKVASVANNAGLKWSDPVNNNLIMSTTQGYFNNIVVGDNNSGGETLSVQGSPATYISRAVPRNLFADMSNVSAATVNQLRQAFAIQRFQELSMRGGSRYVEYVMNTFGIRTPDASLQRPQYVGGSTAPMVISEVLQTSSSTQDSAQGNMAGHGVGAGVSPVIKYHSLENGCLMCLMSVMPRTGYYQGLHRQFNRSTRYDFAQPLLAHLGEQGIKNSEIYAQGNAQDDDIFGYTRRYAEYCSMPNMVTGEMRDTLEFWQNGRRFSQLPVLNSEFVTSNPSNRIFAVESETEDHLVTQVVHHIKALRPLPKYGIPRIDG